MDNKLLDYIKTLSNRDKKTLSQKIVKTMEEVGELAREILPYENADGTKHRFSVNESILEESVDAMLCILSIAYETGATDEEIEKMLWKKAEYWNKLQVTESKTKYPLPFEIHVTVEENNQEKFEDVCKIAGVKPIYLDLYDKDGKCLKLETMTASKMAGTNLDAYKELSRICGVLEEHGIHITRKKIETVPWHPAAVGGTAVAEGSYFEMHFNVSMAGKPFVTDMKELLNIVHSDAIGGVLSANLRKMDSFLVTIRDTSMEQILRCVEVAKIELGDYEPRNFLMEYAIYDTNVLHDSSWINS